MVETYNLSDVGIIDDSGSNDDLYDLFTIKEYQAILVEIPRFDGTHNYEESCDGNDDKSMEPLLVEIFQSPAACTDPDLTGQVLWPVSRLLSHYIASKHGLPPRRSRLASSSSSSSSSSSCSVLELGAGGTGLPSIVASLLSGSDDASIVVATDGNDGIVLDLLRKNIKHHQHLNEHSKQSQTQQQQQQQDVSPILPKLSCRQLLWGDCHQIQTLRNEVREHYIHTNQNYHHLKRTRRRPTFDYIIAADVVQWPAVLEPLLHTVKAFMWQNDDDDVDDDEDDATNNCKNPDETDESLTILDDITTPLFILGIVERSSTIYEQFISLAESMGFIYRSIDYKDYLVDGIVPVSCQEYGGRITKLLELSLRPSELYGEKPLLLLSDSERQRRQNSLDGDTHDTNNTSNVINYTVGALYQHTTFLPC